MKKESSYRRIYENRMIALSDGVFALAIAILLIVSNVPTNFTELLDFVKDIPTFGICIIFIYWIWNEQNRVFSFYDLFDGKMNTLNMLLLFFVLTYIYPLKFLMKWLIGFLVSIIRGTLREDYETMTSMIPMENVPLLMIIYSIGFISIFFCLFIMHKYGMSQKEFQGFGQKQKLKVIFHKNQMLYTTIIGTISMLFAIGSFILSSPIGSFISGIVYNLLWIVSIVNDRKYQKALHRIDPP